MPPIDPIKRLDLPRTDREGAAYLATLRPDCRHYNGYKPCGYQFACEACESFETRGARVAIIKLGAMGDVLRTTPLLGGLRKAHPGGFEVHWIVERSGAPLLAHHPAIKRVVAIEDHVGLLGLDAIEFDALYCFDKEPPALGLATRLRAKRKLGYAPNPRGGLGVFNEASWRALKLGLDDPYKFRVNEKTHLEILFEMAELPYACEEYEMPLGPASVRGRVAWRKRFVERGSVVVGVNPGAGFRFPTKRWPDEPLVAFARSLRDAIPGAAVALLGGPDERERFASLLAREPELFVPTSNDLPLEEFIGLVGALDLLVSTDSLAMHLAIAQRVPVCALFGSTSAVEIELFGRGEKLDSADFPCSPCYLKECVMPAFCMDAMTGERVARAAISALAERRAAMEAMGAPAAE